MDEETQKIIAEQMKTLPKDVLSAIISVDYKTKLQEITQRQRLLIDQAGQLEMETALVMIGLEPLADFVGNIQKELNLPIVKAKEVAMDVSENIFKPIRDSLQRMNEELEEAVNDELPAVSKQSSSEASLNRDQILKEIEDPSIINGGDIGMKFTSVPTTTSPAETGNKIEIRPAQALETVPGQGVKDLSPKANAPEDTNVYKAKMTGTTIISQQFVNAKPEVKLPEVEKKRPTSGVDPYREAVS